MYCPSLHESLQNFCIHIIGTDASTLIHEVIVAMKAGNGTVDNILKSVHIHPALSEVIARAADQIK
ncbi:MAG TPA: hypothetical protein VIP56_00910 [Nitrososphaeraceae archaeon]